MSDTIVRATAANGQIRAFAITSRDMVETARIDHYTSPVVTAALGRLLSAGAMMGTMMKNDQDLLTLQIISTGEIKGMTVTANAKGVVKGYPTVAQVDRPLTPLGKLDVGGAVGPGMLRVVKDLGLKEPYVGSTELQTGEIAEDLTYYFATSEQTPSSVGLGVLVNRDQSVKVSGGFIIQLMPDTDEEVIDQLEQRIGEIKSVTDMLLEDNAPSSLLKKVLDGFDVEILDEMPTSFTCDCSKQRVAKAISSIKKTDLKEIIDDNEPIEVKCQFCNKAYEFDVDELKEIYNG